MVWRRWKRFFLDAGVLRTVGPGNFTFGQRDPGTHLSPKQSVYFDSHTRISFRTLNSPDDRPLRWSRHNVWRVLISSPPCNICHCNVGRNLIINTIIWLQVLYFFLPMALRPNVGHGLLIHEVSRSHTTTHHIRYDSSGRVISSSQRPLLDSTQQSQQTNIHAPGGIRTHNLSRRAAVDLRLTPRGHWDRRMFCILLFKLCILIVMFMYSY